MLSGECGFAWLGVKRGREDEGGGKIRINVECTKRKKMRGKVRAKKSSVRAVIVRVESCF